MLPLRDAELGLQEQLLAWKAGRQPGCGPRSRRSPREPQGRQQWARPSAPVPSGWGLTPLDHLSQVGLSKDLGHAEHHECVLGADEVCAQCAVQEAQEELGVDEQVLLHKGSPVVG